MLDVAFVAVLVVVLLAWIAWRWMFAPGSTHAWEEAFDSRRPRDLVAAGFVVVGTAVGAVLYLAVRLF
jgi:hypothetical protein